MLALAWPLQWLAFIPVVAIECEVFRRNLRVPLRELVWPMAKANFHSTLLGIPLAWIGMLLIEFAAGGALSLVPDAVEIPRVVHYLMFPLMAAWVGDNIWQAFGAYVILAVPFCVASIYIERRTLRHALGPHDRVIIDTLTRKANVLSYAALCYVALVYALRAPA
jgi:hypothetical protein